MGSDIFEQQGAIKKSTVVGHRKVSGIEDNPKNDESSLLALEWKH